jgi:hypothetical protein
VGQRHRRQGRLPYDKLTPDNAMMLFIDHQIGLRRYRKKGPHLTTRLLLRAIEPPRNQAMTLLDIGGGVGTIPHELLASGLSGAVLVEASSAYLQAAENEAIRRGHRLFNRFGFEQVSIDQIMSHAGLTRGGFYNHFDSKAQLYAAAVTSYITCNPFAVNAANARPQIIEPRKLARTLVNSAS